MKGKKKKEEEKREKKKQISVWRIFRTEMFQPRETDMFKYMLFPDISARGLKRQHFFLSFSADELM